VQHGHETISAYLNAPGKRAAFLAAVDACAPGVAASALALFDQWWRDIQFQTYVTSVSEHYSSEDIHGRLSMWRAFGRSTAKVAIVIKRPQNQNTASSLNLLFSPVAYFTATELDAHFHNVLDLIGRNAVFLKTTDQNFLRSAIFYMFVLGVICLKHEGFLEEREWRIIYSPKRMPSTLMKASVEAIDGVPQTVFSIPFEGPPPADLSEMNLSNLLERVIIGPSPYPWVMYDAFTTALAEAGVPDPGARVFVSGIPIRS
jgi:hypothetical protein